MIHRSTQCCDMIQSTAYQAASNGRLGMPGFQDFGAGGNIK